MSQVPIPPTVETKGMLYFARMLDKIRKHASGELREDFTPRLGQGFDGMCTAYLHVAYPALVERTLAGGSDEEILDWCIEQGRGTPLNAVELLVWNTCLTNAGIRDFASEPLAHYKAEAGLADRDDIDTIFAFMAIDER